MLFLVSRCYYLWSQLGFSKENSDLFPREILALDLPGMQGKSLDIFT